MKKRGEIAIKLRKSISILLIAGVVACQPAAQPHEVFERFRSASQNGEFSKARLIADTLKSLPGNENYLWKVDSILEIMERVKIDFSLCEEQIFNQLSVRQLDYNPDKISQWEKANWLECRVIDGEKRYYRRAVSNLALLLKFHNREHTNEFLQPENDFDRFKLSHIREVIAATKQPGQLTNPVEMLLNHTITLNDGAVPSGQKVNCWMPFPQENHQRQKLIGLISTFPENHDISPAGSPHRTIFLEQMVKNGEKLRFQTKARIQVSAQYFNLREMKFLPYKKETGLYRKFTSEQPPHIVFSDRIRDLSKQIVGEAQAPDEIVRRIYYWIDANIPWTGAIEYGLMSSLTDYTLDNMRGDCGMVTLLFMTLARYNGIPVKWQSGWMLHPGEVNLHDWCEVYYESYGWVPLDMSFGLMSSENIQEREFYISGMDAYRLIVNDDIGAPLYPAKKFFRSEPWDFQRGELEWEGGNLYFDKWRYSMKVDYLPVEMQ